MMRPPVRVFIPVNLGWCACAIPLTGMSEPEHIRIAVSVDVADIHIATGERAAVRGLFGDDVTGPAPTAVARFQPSEPAAVAVIVLECHINQPVCIEISRGARPPEIGVRRNSY